MSETKQAEPTPVPVSELAHLAAAKRLLAGVPDHEGFTLDLMLTAVAWSIPGAQAAGLYAYRRRLAESNEILVAGLGLWRRHENEDWEYRTARDPIELDVSSAEILTHTLLFDHTSGILTR